MDDNLTHEMCKVPLEIHNELVAQQTELGWPDVVPKFVEFERDGREMWTSYLSTTVGQCNQICEHHTRKAVVAILAWEKKPTVKWRRRAGRHILVARLIRCRYLELMNIENPTEYGMPFPCLSRESDDG